MKKENTQVRNELIQVVNNETVTTSLIVAKSFNKRHDNVMKSIDDLVGEMGLLKIEDTPLFRKSTYTHEQNGQVYPVYYMNRDGFTLLAMGFTGKEALEWKLKYIKAFNDMEKRLHSLHTNPPIIDNRIEIAKLLVRAPKASVDAIKELYPEYFPIQTGKSLLERTSDANTSYQKWIEDYNITIDWIQDFPTNDIYNNYMRYCKENRHTGMGKKTFYTTLELDFGLRKKQYSDGRRYFVSA